MNEFFVYPIELWTFIFWVSVQLPVFLGLGTIFNFLISAISESNFLTSKLIFRQINNLPTYKISSDFGNPSFKIGLYLFAFFLDVVFTLMYIV